MKYEISAGAVVFYKDPETSTIFYVLLHYGAGHWDLPKGKIENNETPEQAAIREVKEETGLDIQLIKGFEQSYTYFFKEQSQILVQKKVIFFISEVKTQNVKLSYEHTEYAWLPYKDAIKQLTFENTRQLLQMADQFLRSREAQ